MQKILFILFIIHSNSFLGKLVLPWHKVLGGSSTYTCLQEGLRQFRNIKNPSKNEEAVCFLTYLHQKAIEFRENMKNCDKEFMVHAEEILEEIKREQKNIEKD